MQGSQQNLFLWWLNELGQINRSDPALEFAPRGSTTCQFLPHSHVSYKLIKWNHYKMAAVKVELSTEAITHSKLIVGIDWSFPHRSGIVETLHIVGLVEAGGGERWGKFQAKIKCDDKRVCSFHRQLQLIIIKWVTYVFYWLDNLVRDRFALQPGGDLKNWLHCETLDVWSGSLRKDEEYSYIALL